LSYSSVSALTMSDFEITPIGCSNLPYKDSITGSPLIPCFTIILAASAKLANLVFRFSITCFSFSRVVRFLCYI